ncbi:MAG: rhomboid family intramembrane serine protease [Rhodospirillales bacterium]|nr:rhomboid family intramembrane serine protease [Rhodospirillales bacterium]
MIPFRTSAPTTASPVVTMGLIVANIAVYFYQMGLAGPAANLFIYTFALVPAVYSHPQAALDAGLDPDSYLPLITNTFMHGGPLHLIFNMWTLWLFGGPLESRLGRVGFILFYLFCGALGSLGHLAFNLDSTIPALGASGAIAGVLGGYAWLFPKARISIVQPIFFFPLIFQLPALVYTAVWFGLQIFQGVIEFANRTGEQAGGIAWWAHIGGFAAGLLLVRFYAKRHPAS